MKVALRAWYRLPLADYWHNVQLAGPFVVESKQHGFVFETLIDDWTADGPKDNPEIVFRAYLFTDVSAEVLAVLRGDTQVTGLVASDDGFGSFPPAYSHFVRKSASRLASLSTRVLDLVQWQCEIRGGAPGFEPRGFLHWAALDSAAASLQTLNWQPIPRGVISLPWSDPDRLLLTPDLSQHVSELLASGVDAPLGHSLLREAWRAQDSDLRSSLVMAVAAAETGVKQCVARIVPDAAWLVQELPAPPLERMVSKYLPTLPSRAPGYATIPPVSRAIVSVLRGAVEDRNRLVHGREVSVTREGLGALLDTVSTLLKFLDFHGGQPFMRSA